MSLTLGEKLKIRSMIYVAAEPVPFFWPMRSFIHHNPLHGLEHLPFAEAVEKGSKIFHGRSFLSRSEYQGYLADGRADRRTLIVNFSNDVRRVLEVGQSVLMDIGQKRMQARNIIEEIRNLTRQWTSEDDLIGETGVFMALELLETLEKEF